jgi:ketosteroid isomerase-like protein
MYGLAAVPACQIPSTVHAGEGNPLWHNTVLIYHFRDGKVSEAWNQATDLYAQDEFWS